MFDLDDLRMVSQFAESSDKMKPEEWMEEEGFDYHSLMNFAKEDGIRLVQAHRGVLDNESIPRELYELSLTMTGIIAGLRYGNLLHRIKNPEVPESI